MKIIVIAVLFAVVNAADQSCYKNANFACISKSLISYANCTSKYGGIDKLLPRLQSYANDHILRSFEYLLISTHFGNYQKNREGFQKLFRKMSDTTWSDAIGLMKHIAKRGGQMNFKMSMEVKETNTSHEMYEFESLAKAVDVQKKLAETAFKIHEEATRRHDNTHDPEISQYMEEEFIEKHPGPIRELTGHVADLSKMLSSNDHSIALYLFDQYLEKL